MSKVAEYTTAITAARPCAAPPSAPSARGAAMRLGGREPIGARRLHFPIPIIRVILVLLLLLLLGGAKTPAAAAAAAVGEGLLDIVRVAAHADDARGDTISGMRSTAARISRNDANGRAAGKLGKIDQIDPLNPPEPITPIFVRPVESIAARTAAAVVDIASALKFEPLSPITFDPLLTNLSISPPSRRHHHRRLGDDWCSLRSTTGTHTLPAGGPVCTVPTHIFVAAGTALSLRTKATASHPVVGDALAIISGGSKTRIFGIDGGELTLADLVLEKGAADRGAAIFAQNGAKVVLHSAVTIRVCASAIFGAGVVLTNSDTLLTVTEESTHVIIEGNTAPLGAGVVVLAGAGVLVEDTAKLTLKNNKATTGNGGGMYLQDKDSTFSATGLNTSVAVESNTAGQAGGGIYFTTGADMLVENGATVVIQENTATSLVGGGVSLSSEGSTLTATGTGTRLTVESNTAGQYGGGMFSMSGADVMVESGAALVGTRH
jgi:predicted outer membrane repeat protein